jgi:hypothetical protein
MIPVAGGSEQRGALDFVETETELVGFEAVLVVVGEKAGA